MKKVKDNCLLVTDLQNWIKQNTQVLTADGKEFIYIEDLKRFMKETKR